MKYQYVRICLHFIGALGQAGVGTLGGAGRLGAAGLGGGGFAAAKAAKYGT